MYSVFGVGGGPGLLASLLEPVPPPAVGVRKMTKALLVPFLGASSLLKQ